MIKDIKNFEGVYSIDEFSNVINIKTGHVLKATKGNHGYLTVSLYKKNKGKTSLVHRLVADAFIPNSDNKRCVNHKDGNRTNNSILNLEWATHSENTSHSYRELNRKCWMNGRTGKLNHKSRAIEMRELDGTLIKRFDSIMDAERDLNILNSSICNHLAGKTKTCNNKIFNYEKK